MTKFYTLEEVLKEVERQKYKLIWLENQFGEVLKGANAPSIAVKEQVKRIFELLGSDLYPDGKYLIKAKTSTKDKALAAIMPYLKGKENNNVRPIGEEPPALYKFSENEVKVDVSSYLNVYALNAKLQAENEMLKSQRASLTARNEMMEDELRVLREDNRGLAEEAGEKGFDLSQLSPFIPLITELIKKPEAPALDPEKEALKKAVIAMGENQKKMFKTLLVLQKQREPDPEEEEGEEIDFETEEEMLDFIEANYGLEALSRYKAQNNIN